MSESLNKTYTDNDGIPAVDSTHALSHSAKQPTIINGTQTNIGSQSGMPQPLHSFATNTAIEPQERLTSPAKTATLPNSNSETEVNRMIMNPSNNDIKNDIQTNESHSSNNETFVIPGLKETETEKNSIMNVISSAALLLEKDGIKPPNGANVAVNSVTIPRTAKSQQQQQHHSDHPYLLDSQPNPVMSRSYHPSPTHKAHDGSARTVFMNNEGNIVTMRRSSSVPCKRTTIERGSTSSSDDSGFSPGSPNTSANINGVAVDQALERRMKNVNANDEKIPPTEAEETNIAEQQQKNELYVDSIDAQQQMQTVSIDEQNASENQSSNENSLPDL